MRETDSYYNFIFRLKNQTGCLTYVSQQQQFDKQRLTSNQQMKTWYQQNKEKKKKTV